jgi:hypothetical protein
MHHYCQQMKGVRMKNLMLVVLGAAMIAMVTGCKKPAKDAPAAGQQPATEQSAKDQAPKDHPAH